VPALSRSIAAMPTPTVTFFSSPASRSTTRATRSTIAAGVRSSPTGSRCRTRGTSL
jgi:hypothetical protein